MNEKVLSVVEKMISTPEKIEEIHSDKGEYYFRFDKKYIWSIIQRSNPEIYILYFYPTYTGSVQRLIHELDSDPQSAELVHYKSDDFEDSVYAKSVMKKLHLHVKDQLYDVDSKLDDILNS